MEDRARRYNTFSKWKMMSSLSSGKIKSQARYLLAIVFASCSLWLVWDLCSKYFSGLTTILTVQEYKENLPLPKLLLCSDKRYKQDELASMGLPTDFFDSLSPDLNMFRSNDSFPNLNVTWQRSTLNTTDFDMDWEAYEGVTYHIINSVNIIYFSTTV